MSLFQHFALSDAVLMPLGTCVYQGSTEIWLTNLTKKRHPQFSIFNHNQTSNLSSLKYEQQTTGQRAAVNLQVFLPAIKCPYPTCPVAQTPPDNEVTVLTDGENPSKRKQSHSSQDSCSYLCMA